MPPAGIKYSNKQYIFVDEFCIQFVWRYWLAGILPMQSCAWDKSSILENSRALATRRNDSAINSPPSQTPLNNLNASRCST